MWLLYVQKTKKFLWKVNRFTCWKPAIEALKQGVKSAQSKDKDFTICTHRICGMWSLFPAFLISPVGIYVPKVNNRNTRRCDKDWNQFKSKNKDFLMTSVLVSLLLTWSIFNIWFQCTYCWFWVDKCVVDKYFTNYYIFQKLTLYTNLVSGILSGS